MFLFFCIVLAQDEIEKKGMSQKDVADNNQGIKNFNDQYVRSIFFPSGQEIHGYLYHTLMELLEEFNVISLLMILIIVMFYISATLIGLEEFLPRLVKIARQPLGMLRRFQCCYHYSYPMTHPLLYFNICTVSSEKLNISPKHSVMRHNLN